ncbi:MAG: putative NAD/FAD-binding protein [Myxococcota bacterium]|jgi:predicted NAD/FAD-binding protein
MKIAVVGSGIGGLAASWMLGQQHDVTVYERHESAGMGAFAVTLGDAAIDVPLRVFYRGYYPTLTKLYAAVGVRIAQVNYAASFSDFEGPTYFRYQNLIALGRSIPWIGPRVLADKRGRAIVVGLARYYRQTSRDLASGRLDGVELGDYLRDQDYPSAFVDGFLLPAMAAICTCSYDSVRRYPANVIGEYMTRGVVLQGVSRAVDGSQDVVSRLLANATLRAGTSVVGLKVADAGVDVTDSQGLTERYDHVVLASQANQAQRLLADQDPALSALLGAFPHERSEVVIHRDPRLAPRDRKRWSSVNFVVSRDAPRPMATIVMNSVQPRLSAARPVFQTWNPLHEPEPDTVLARASFERPMVTTESATALGALQDLQRRPNRRVWVCGSYASPGIPLLEGGVTSAITVARALGVTVSL